MFCVELADPENGRVNVSDRAEPGAIADYNCNEGFVLNGPETRECGEDGRWTDFDPTCERNTIRK